MAAIISGPLTPIEVPAELLERIGTTSGAMLESNGSDGLLERAESVLGQHESLGGTGKFKDELLGTMAGAVSELQRDEDRSIDQLRPEQQMSLEALVKLVGRPALRLSNGDTPLDLANPEMGTWTGRINSAVSEIASLASSVGRIDLRFGSDWRHGGTGFVIGPNQIMTNRHVIDLFTTETSADGETRLELSRDASINFDADAADEKHRFKVKSVVSSGLFPIGKFVEVDKLDMAILEIETNNGHRDHPEKISSERVSTRDTDNLEISVVGYPAEPSFTAAPSGQQQAQEFWKRIQEIFQQEFGVKYFSPGEIRLRPGKMPGDVRDWAFSHDATTMGGNSGSIITTFKNGLIPCGLHFGGATLRRNMAHDLLSVDFNTDLV